MKFYLRVIALIAAVLTIAPVHPTTAESASQPPGSSVVWRADHESGNNGQWDGVWISGDASSVVTTEMARSGRYGNALTIYNADGNGSSPGVRMTYQGRDIADKTDPNNLPTEAFYSVWYYIPETVEVTWWNIFQWKAGYEDNNGRTARALYWHDLYNKDGELYLKLYTRVNSNGEWVKGWANSLAVSPIPVPTGEWFHLESYYKWDSSGNGRVATWLNGQKIWDIGDLKTEFDWNFGVYRREWAINNYANNTTPETHTIYIDDATISTQRMGPS